MATDFPTIAVPAICRDGSVSRLLAPRIDAAGRLRLGQYSLTPRAAVQLAFALHACAAPLIDAEACAADPEPCTLPLFGEAA